MLFDDFVKTLSNAHLDRLILVDIYDVAGREKKSIKKEVSSKKLVKEVKKRSCFLVLYSPSIKKTFEYIKKEIKDNSVLMIVGAGDIYKLSKYFS